MPLSMVRLSAGRAEMSEELQALCFLAGANSIFYGEKLLTTGNPDVEADQALFARLGLVPMPVPTPEAPRAPCTSTCSARRGDGPPVLRGLRWRASASANACWRRAPSARRPLTQRPATRDRGARRRKVAIDGKVLVNFCSNDYLGLSQPLDVVTAMQAAAAYHGVGQAPRRWYAATSSKHAALEREAAEWMG
jgi:hypothetical protein